MINHIKDKSFTTDHLENNSTAQQKRDYLLRIQQNEALRPDSINSGAAHPSLENAALTVWPPTRLLKQPDEKWERKAHYQQLLYPKRRFASAWDNSTGGLLGELVVRRPQHRQRENGVTPMRYGHRETVIVPSPRLAPQVNLPCAQDNTLLFLSNVI